MPFPDSVRLDVLVRSGRHCCVCNEFAGRTANVHHIVQEALGGANSIDNAICLCQRCHSEAGHYNTSHPLGTKYSPQELRAHRDAWWRQPTLASAPSDEVATFEAYALGILVKTEDPGLSVLSALATCSAANLDFTNDPVPNVNLVSLPHPQLVEGDFDWSNPREVGKRIPWPWLIVKESVQVLRSRHLLHFHTVHGRGGFGSTYLSERGQSVVRSLSFPSAE
jgi:HNH endonuclease